MSMCCFDPLYKPNVDPGLLDSFVCFTASATKYSRSRFAMLQINL